MQTPATLEGPPAPSASAAVGQRYQLSRLVFNWAVELTPVIAFWISFQLTGMMTAIAWSLGSTVAAVTLGLLVQRRWPLFPLTTTVFALIFSGYSLIYQSPSAFVFQHTLYYGLGGVLLFAGLARGQYWLKPLFENLFAVSDHGWRILTFRWAVLFFVIASGNEWVWRTMSESAWATYKLGITITITLFGLWQLRVARRERLPNASKWGFKVYD